MADNEKGGLSSIDPMANFAQKIQTQTAESQQILDEHRKRLMDLMSSRQQMPFNPAMMALATGLLSPTKTGGFGESLGAGMTAYAGEAEKQFRRQQEEAKLAYELQIASEEQKRKMMGQQFFGQLASRKKPTLAQPATETAPVTTAEAAPARAEAVPSAEVVSSAEAAPSAQAAPVAQKEVPTPPSSPDQVLAQVNKNDAQIKNLLSKIQSSGSDAFSDISNEEIAMLEMYSPEYAKMINSYRDAVNKGTTLDVSRLNAFVAASKLELDKVQEIRNQAKLDLERRELGLKERKLKVDESSIENSLPGVGNIKMPSSFWDELKTLTKSEDFTFDKLLNFYRKNNLAVNTTVDAETGKLRFMTENERNVKAKKDEARFTQAPIKRQIPEYGAGEFDITPVDYSDYLEARRKGPDALQHWFNGSQFSGVVIPNSKIGTKLNSPELTNPPPVSEAAPKPEVAAEPTAQRAVPPADRGVVTEAAPVPRPDIGAATTEPKPAAGKVLSAQALERQRQQEELERQIRLNREKEEEQTRQAAPRKRAEEETKTDVEFGNNIMKEGTNAQNIRIIAKDLKSIATSNPKILDVMQDTTVTDALARTIQSGLITPWGSVSIDPKDLYVAVDNFASKKPGVTKADRDAYSLFLRNIAQLTILERRMSRGEGAISDKETGLFQQVNVLPSDSALAVRLKAELIEERANVTEKVGNAFYKYKKKAGGSYEDFTHSSEFMDIKKGYEKRLDRIRDANAKLLGGVSSPAAKAEQTTLPPEALAQLKEKKQTRFANGQVWTLQNGKPVRLK